MKQVIAATVALVMLASCNTGYDKTASGLVYKIFPGKGGAKPKPSDFVKFHLDYLIGDKDSVLNSTFAHMPGYTGIDTSERSKYSFMEILRLMSAGDSASISISIDTLVSRKLVPGYDEKIFIKGGNIKCHLKVLQIFSSDKEIDADYKKESAIEKAKEIKELDAYIAKNNLKAIKTKNGAYVVIENAGDQTMKADSGKVASVIYKGYLTNGIVFDTNMDTSKGKTEPYEVHVGGTGVIEGWQEGLPYFGNGGKGKILVPAMLGYGPQAQGTDIPPYSNLVFDIEVVKVEVAPKNPPAQKGLTPEQMQQMQQQQQQQQQQQSDGQ